jgi:hypothetical protein
VLVSWRWYQWRQVGMTQGMMQDRGRVQLTGEGRPGVVVLAGGEAGNGPSDRAGGAGHWRKDGRFESCP